MAGSTHRGVSWDDAVGKPGRHPNSPGEGEIRAHPIELRVINDRIGGICPLVSCAWHASYQGDTGEEKGEADPDDARPDHSGKADNKQVTRSSRAVMAILVISIALLGVFQVVAGAIGTNADSRNRALATRFAERQLEAARGQRSPA